MNEVTVGLERTLYIQCVLEHGGLSEFEMNDMPEAPRKALRAVIEAACGHMEEKN